jgi:ribosomal protein S27E
MKDNVQDSRDLLADNEGHKCPRCSSSDIAFTTPTTLISIARLHTNPNTGTIEPDTKTPDGQYYRLKCNNCKLSTQNHVNLMKALNEWNTFITTKLDNKKDDPQ